MTDPRDLRGSIAGPGGPHDRHGVALDTTRAVLLDGVEVCAVEPAGGSPAGMIALLLSGRVNQTRGRADVLYLFDVDGAAAIVTELLALAHRMDARGLAGVIRQRLAQLDAEGGLVNPLVDPAALRQELIQIAAVAVAWVEAIDRAAR